MRPKVDLWPPYMHAHEVFVFVFKIVTILVLLGSVLQGPYSNNAKYNDLPITLGPKPRLSEAPTPRILSVTPATHQFHCWPLLLVTGLSQRQGCPLPEGKTMSYLTFYLLLMPQDGSGSAQMCLINPHGK